jgi:uncharacterized protein
LDDRGGPDVGKIRQLPLRPKVRNQEAERRNFQTKAMGVGQTSSSRDETMTIDWAHFSPWSALFGGLLIGAAAAVLVLGTGRILGAAGVFAGLLSPGNNDQRWRLSLIVGLLLAPIFMKIVGSDARPYLNASWPVLIIAGLLVGFGTRLGSGCTSGHGICGIARLSRRSFVATALFMLSAVLTVFLTRHLPV